MYVGVLVLVGVCVRVFVLVCVGCLYLVGVCVRVGVCDVCVGVSFWFLLYLGVRSFLLVFCVLVVGDCRCFDSCTRR